MESGIQLLIVAPNQRSSVSSAIDRAYDKGIPVIVFERKTDSHKYSAFVSADNYEMGRLIGEYVVSRLDGKGNVLEVAGLKGSSPAEERHNGFFDALAQYPEVKVVKMLQGDWTEPTAYQAVKDYKGDSTVCLARTVASVWFVTRCLMLLISIQHVVTYFCSWLLIFSRVNLIQRKPC